MAASMNALDPHVDNPGTPHAFQGDPRDTESLALSEVFIFKEKKTKTNIWA